MTARVRKGNFQNGLLSYCKRKKIGLKNKATSLYTRTEAYKNYVCFTNKGVLYLTNLSFLKLFCFQSVIIISNAQSSIFIHFLNCQTAVNSSTGSDLFLVLSFPAKQALWSSQWTSSCQTQDCGLTTISIELTSILYWTWKHIPFFWKSHLSWVSQYDYFLYLLYFSELHFLVSFSIFIFLQNPLGLTSTVVPFSSQYLCFLCELLVNIPCLTIS